jgi:1,5-anhydro-D-fructose reductase (1,5-anhydro-D-mannitol-forming)
MDSVLRVAVIGLGLIGRRRAEALKRIEGATLAATVDPALEATRGSDGVPHYRAAGELPPDAYDAAVVAVPHHLTLATAAAVLKAGRPVLVEKPLCVRPADARALEELAGALPMASFVGYNYRYLPAVAELVRRATSGALGRPRSVEMLVGHGGHPRSAAGWKLDPIRAGGGVLLDPGVHLLDLLSLLAPEARPTHIEATHGFWPTAIEEDLLVAFRSHRLLATIRVSHIRWVNTFRVEVFGEEGYAIAEGRGGNYGSMTLRLGHRWAWTEANAASQRDTEEIWDFGAQDHSLHAELAHVVARWRGDRIDAGEPQSATIAEGRAITELCDRLYRRLQAHPSGEPQSGPPPTGRSAAPARASPSPVLQTGRPR